MKLRFKESKLPAAAERSLLDEAFRVRGNFGEDAVTLAAVAPVAAAAISPKAARRPSNRRRARMNALLARTKRYFVKLLNTCDRSAGPKGCWRWLGKTRSDRNEKAIVLNPTSSNYKQVIRELAAFCGCPLPPRIRLRMQPGCSEGCVNPAHCLDYQEATSGKAK